LNTLPGIGSVVDASVGSDAVWSPEDDFVAEQAQPS